MPTMELELIAITQDGTLAKPVASLSPLTVEVVEATTQLYNAVAYEPPWVGYLALENGSCVGTCGFKSPPTDNRVEIAYFTFPGNESKGIATRMASALIQIANNTAPDVTVAAQTLPEENASTSVLRKLKFRCLGSVEHPEDGLVWEWQLINTPDA
jgi:RimJ/RimL family protein N-acetyltransferase